MGICKDVIFIEPCHVDDPGAYLVGGALGAVPPRVTKGVPKKKRKEREREKRGKEREKERNKERRRDKKEKR